MKPLRIFISSVQKEFAEERMALRDYLLGDALLRRFFECFLFEEVPAADRRADEVYLDEVERCDIYLGLFGNDYGYEDGEGVSPTQREFEEATKFHKHRLIFVKGADDSQRTPKMRSLIQKAGNQLIRRRVASTAELIAGLYSALVQYLEDRQLIRNGPFDAAPCRDANLADLDPGLMAQFIRRARLARGLPLPEEAMPQELLTHLNLMDRENLTHAAVLLFGKQPQRFLLSSEVKCAHFHGLEVASAPSSCALERQARSSMSRSWKRSTLPRGCRPVRGGRRFPGPCGRPRRLQTSCAPCGRSRYSSPPPRGRSARLAGTNPSSSAPQRGRGPTSRPSRGLERR